jgi:hypothetical protein
MNRPDLTVVLRCQAPLAALSGRTMGCFSSIAQARQVDEDMQLVQADDETRHLP